MNITFDIGSFPTATINSENDIGSFPTATINSEKPTKLFDMICSAINEFFSVAWKEPESTFTLTNLNLFNKDTQKRLAVAMLRNNQSNAVRQTGKIVIGILENMLVGDLRATDIVITRSDETGKATVTVGKYEAVLSDKLVDEKKLKISLVAAMNLKRVIGRDGKLPWHIPEDLAVFKCITMGKAVLMGRKTFESIGRPLPGRRNIVLTRQLDWNAEDVEVVHKLEHAIALLDNTDELCVIGGADIYQQTLPLADKIYLTVVNNEADGDAYFPEFDESQWDYVAGQPFATESCVIQFQKFTRKKTPLRLIDTPANEYVPE